MIAFLSVRAESADGGESGAPPRAAPFRRNGERENSDGDVEFSFCPPQDGGRQAIWSIIGAFRAVKSAGNAGNICAKAGAGSCRACRTGIIRTGFGAADFRLNRVIRLANTVKY